MGRIYHFMITIDIILAAVFSIILTHAITPNVVSAKTIFCPNAPPSYGYLVCNGTNNADNMIGTPSQDLMNGFGGNDKMVGKGGSDDMYGGSGNDTITVTSTSFINCGAGYDIANIYTKIESGSVDDNCEIILVGD
jgi:Ca2+-binding RTX toxin-like protein